MKKFAAIIVAALFAVVVFTACSEKQLTAADVEGTWLNVVEGSVVTNTFIYTFNSDMTYSVVFSADTDVVSMGSENTGKYFFLGSTITITENSESRSFKVKFKDGNMIWVTEAGYERVFVRQ